VAVMAADQIIGIGPVQGLRWSGGGSVWAKPVRSEVSTARAGAQPDWRSWFDTSPRTEHALKPSLYSPLDAALHAQRPFIRRQQSFPSMIA
jgi:hypothetical protein